MMKMRENGDTLSRSCHSNSIRAPVEDELSHLLRLPKSLNFALVRIEIGLQLFTWGCYELRSTE